MDLMMYRLIKEDVLIARMADPGHEILFEEDMKMMLSSYLIRFKPIGRCHARLIQYWLKSDAYWRLVKGQAAGTTRVSLNAKVLSSFSLVIPHAAVAREFAAVVDPVRYRLVKNAAEMQRLESIRDTLLPKLVSGEIRIQDAEGFLDAVA